MLYDARLMIQKTFIEDTTSRYEIASIDAGYAVALGNALRRILLSSLPGSAITSMRIEGVQHEFQAIPNVLEDVTDIAFTMKKVRLRCFADHPVKMRLDVQGEREVIAADIIVPSIVEIANPELHIATLDNEHAHLVIDLIAENGRGFVSADEQAAHATEAFPIGMILIDAIYSPVNKVNMRVEPLYRGQRENTDMLVLEITTDGTLSPDEALRQSAAILEQQFAVFANYQHAGEANVWKRTTSSDVPIPPLIYSRSIEDIALSPRALNCLRRHGTTKIGQILEMDREDLIGIRNFGEKTLQEITQCLEHARCFPETKKTGQVTS